MAGGLNLYGFAAGDPVNSRDPFGLCPDTKDPKCDNYGGAVAFRGLQAAAVLAAGISVAAGTYNSEAGDGMYLRFGFGFGVDMATGLEMGGSPSLSALRGGSVGACGGGVALGGCASWNRSGITISGGPSAGLRGIPIPITGHVEGSFTIAPTFGDLLGGAKKSTSRIRDQVEDFKRDAYRAMMGRMQ